MKAALYVRVSTEEQAEEGYSIQAQLNLLKEYCNKNNIEIYDSYSDEGVSGQKENRPEFQRMIKDAVNKSFNIILVHKYDRFARKVELSQRIKNQLSKCGVNLISITEPIEDSPMGFFVSGLHELMAEYYVRNLAQEVKKGMRERVKQGMHNGSVPFGYKINKENGMMVTNEVQALVVKKIFEMYNEGNGSTVISKWLDENGISPAIPGARWNHYAVLYILRNVKYIGYIKHAGEIYQGVHEAIIEKNVFEMAQNNLGDRLIPREVKGKNETRFMLLGLLRCGICGYKMGIHTAKEIRYKKGMTIYSYYVCSRSKVHENYNKCSHSKYYQTKLMEEQILEAAYVALNNMKIGMTISHNNNILIDSQIEMLEREIKNSDIAYRRGVYTLEKYILIEDENNKKIAELKNKKEPKNIVSSQEINSAIDEIKHETDPAKIRLILRRYLKEIRIYPDGTIDFDSI